MDLQFERWFNRQNESLQEAFALIAAIHGLNVAKERCEELGENWNKFKNAAIMAVREISFLP